jgi:hypothetical protein
VRYFQVEAVTVDYSEAGAGRVKVVMNLAVEEGQDPCERALALLGPTAAGADVTIIEQPPTVAERNHT